MKFSLTNIGKIAQADIEINGLTVLGGYNDIGKSTVGKTLFSVIKTVSNREQELAGEKVEQAEQKINSFYVQIRKITGFRPGLPLSEEEYNESKLKKKARIFESVTFYIDKMRKELWFMLGEQPDVRESITLFLKKMREDFQTIITISEEDSGIATKVSGLLDILENDIQEALETENDESYKYRKVFDRINESLFRGSMQNKIASTVISKIIVEDDSCKINIELENEHTNIFETDENFPFRDVTLIESPLLLGWSSAVGGVTQRELFRPNNRGRSAFGHYVFDLLSKVQYSTLDDYHSLFTPPIIHKINEVIGGQMYYDRKKSDFFFKQKKMTNKAVNLASGIKTFGIIQMLLISGMIVPDTVLIIDEPEAHLHPEWQLKYAEVITQLVDMGVYVLVSTHSPYMIEALKHYSEKLQQEKITNFYLGGAGEHGTIFSDVTQDLNPLFELLAKPMRRLL